MKKIVSLIIATLSLSGTSLLAGDAKALYEDQCAKCHGSDGKGQTKMGLKLNAKDYTDAGVQANLKDEAATKAIKEGLKDKDDKVLMKPTEGVSDDDVKGLIAYMRAFKK
jgi:cytochrome c1